MIGRAGWVVRTSKAAFCWRGASAIDIAQLSVGVKVECQTLRIAIGAHSSKGVAIAGYGAVRNLAADRGGIGGNGAIAIAGSVL